MATAVSQGATGNPYIDGVLSGVKWSGTVTYSFPDSPSDYPAGYGSGEPLNNFAQLSAAQQLVIQGIMQQIVNYTNLTITFAGTNGADIRLAQSDDANPTAYAYYPSNATSGTGGDVWFGDNYDFSNPVVGSYEYLTNLHEIGHAFGLKHGQELGGPADVAVPADRDDLEFTVMTYRSYINGPTSGYTNEQWGYPQTYMMIDIAALQTMYGADYTYRSGDTVYKWTPGDGITSVDGSAWITPGGNRIFLTIWDGGGIDTYDFSAYTTGVTVDLTPGSWSTASTAQLAYLGGGNYARANVYNAYLFQGDARSYIENAIGGSGNDTIIGNAVANVLTGNGGNDSLNGGLGADTMIGGIGDDIYFVDNVGDVVTEIANAGTDTVTASFSYILNANVENLTLAAGAGTINGTGNSLANTLTANESNNTLAGGDANDTLLGLAGNDHLYGGAGADVLNGGAGFDFARYDSAGAGVTADLLTPASNTGEAAGDTFTSIEGFVGSTFADTFRGDNNNNSVWALDGDDTLVGNGGADDLHGQNGNDFLYGGAGADVLDGGAGFDFARYDSAGAGVTADLLTPASNTGEAAGDTFTSIEGIVGSNFADMLSGDNSNNTITGGAGNDTIDGRGGTDSTVFSGLRSAYTLTALSGNGVRVTGPDGTDTLTNVEQLVFSDQTVTWPPAAGVADLTATNLSFNGAMVSYLINNIGTATAAASTTGIYLSTDSAITASDTLLTTTSTPSLAAVGSDNESVSLSFPGNLVPGTYYIGAIADYNGQITENSEANNASNAVPIILGSDSINTLTGTSGNNTLLGLAGNDHLYGGAGADVLNGGAGFDFARYDSAGAGVTADLLTPASNTGEAAGDTFTSIEGFVGSTFADTFRGDNNNNSVWALDGDDTLVGNGGADDLHGQNGNDFLYGGAGADVLDGGSGNDTFVFARSEANGDVIVDFNGNGASIGDQLQFVGYGTAAQGATFTQVDATRWSINSSDGLVQDIITLSNSASIHPSDYLFV